MADYKTIHGSLVRSYTTDPDNPIEGQVWYDKTNKVLQFQIPNITSAGAWRTGGNLNTARYTHGDAGTQTAALAFGGYIDSGSGQGETESYNGSTWTELTDLNTARLNTGGAGATNTAAICVGGSPGGKSENELWNGSSWTEVGDLNTGRHAHGTSGTSTSGFCG